MKLAWSFLAGCFNFYRTILTRYVEPDNMPPDPPWTDGT